MSTLTVWTANFTITVDRADHLVVEQIDETGRPVRTIDFGRKTGPAPLVFTWLESENRDELAPAIDAYLTAEFAKSASAYVDGINPWSGLRDGVPHN